MPDAPPAMVVPKRLRFASMATPLGSAPSLPFLNVCSNVYAHFPFRRGKSLNTTVPRPVPRRGRQEVPDLVGRHAGAIARTILTNIDLIS